MRRCILVLSLLFTFSPSFIWAQEETPWSSNFRLQWKDFKGEIPTGANAAATTASGISYNFSSSYENGQMVVNYRVQSFFYPTKSWYRPQICNDVTLLHEQLHFDISEVFARKMAKEMSETEFTKNIKQEVRLLYKRILKELDAFQRRYDLETDFSRNIEKQKLWQKQISSFLGN
ncbi:DUF922 domain-containing protein [Maribacter sp. 4G9]|uniref:DUF922 domain-containing protein n=1 Tax=Maribacter sp. 4G9 TaxID=1889777 RepID=UPI000C5F5B29|nr:DUF922 domain-containing protein [Maribacter sp. 4G9]PIB25314.1 DUF922 domain-containing protein [Maribacter sp. 4G9]